MGKYSGDGVPAHARPRGVVTFQMVGMQFHQSRNDEVAGHIFAGGRVIVGDVGDLPVPNQKRPGDNFVSEDNVRIRQNCFSCHSGDLSFLLGAQGMV